MICLSCLCPARESSGLSGRDDSLSSVILIESVIIGLVAYRLWRLVAKDDITEPIRQRVFWPSNDRPTLELMVSCPWCLGSWVAFGTVLVTHLTGVTSSNPYLLALASATIVGLVARTDT